jgi:hypothetical protein
MNHPRRLMAGFLCAALTALPSFAYEYPLTPATIRSAYILGTESGSARDRFFAQYSQDLPEIHLDGYVSNIRISTPYSQVADRGSQDVNRDLQAAVDAFSSGPQRFRIDAKIYYLEPKSAQPDLRISVFQKDKEIIMHEESRDPEMPYDSPPYGYVVGTNDGEEVVLSCDASKISSDPLRVVIDIPGDVPAGPNSPPASSSKDAPAWSEVAGSPKSVARHIEVRFDLSELK